MKKKKFTKKNICFKARKIPPPKQLLYSFIILLAISIFFQCQPKVQKNYYTISSEHSSPEGVKVSLWKNGAIQYSDIVQDSSYSIGFESDAFPSFDSLTGTKTDYIPYNSGTITFQYHNSTIDINLEPFTEDKLFSFYGDSCTPAGAAIKIYDDGRLLEENLYVNESGSYQSQIFYMPDDQTIDSVNFSKQDYVDANFYEIKVDSGANLLNAQLKIISNYRYYLSGAESSPESTQVKVYYDAALIASAQVKNHTYITDYWYNPENTMYLDSIVYTREGYDKAKFENILASEGQNYLDVNLNKTEAYTFWLYGTDCSPEGTYIEVWHKGQYLAYAYVDNTAYQTGTWSNADSTMTLDSIRFMHEGYVKQIHTNFMVKAGKNLLNVQLSQAKK